MNGAQLFLGCRGHDEETVHFLLLSPQNFLMLISWTFERRKAELTLELLWFWTWCHWNKNENLATRPLFHEFFKKIVHVLKLATIFEKKINDRFLTGFFLNMSVLVISRLCQKFILLKKILVRTKSKWK